MAVGEAVDLWAPFTSDIILEVRSGKLKKYKGLNIESGIDKSLLEGPVHIGKLGIDGDEHDLTFHGGPDKAIHGCGFHHERRDPCATIFMRLTNLAHRLLHALPDLAG